VLNRNADRLHGCAVVHSNNLSSEMYSRTMVSGVPDLTNYQLMTTDLVLYEQSRRPNTGTWTDLAIKYGPKAVKAISSYMRSSGSAPPSMPAVAKQSRPRRPKNSVSQAMVTSSAPAAYGVTYRSTRPRTKMGKKSVIIEHCELLNGGITGSTSFTVDTEYSLNPGLSTLAPWLAPQAVKYEMYRWLEAWFEYVPIAPTSTQGDIGLIPEYNAQASVPNSETIAWDHEGAMIGSVWKGLTLKYDPKKLHALGPYRYVRAGNVYGDLKTYDAGKMWVVTNNEEDDSTIGKLFFHYKVELINPVLEDGASGLVPSATSSFTVVATQTLSSGVAVNIKFDTTEYNPLTIVNTLGAFVLPLGVYNFQGFVQVDTTAGSVCEAITEPEYNGSAIVGAGFTVNTFVTGSTVMTPVPFQGTFVSDGSSIFNVLITVNSSGTLTVTSGTIRFQPA
jgi:hypothetical protein